MSNEIDAMSPEMPPEIPRAMPPEMTTQEAMSLTGFEQINGILEGRFAPPSIGTLMKYKMHAVAEGRVVFRSTPDDTVLNPMGSVHGGWYGTLLDSAMACAVATRVPKGFFSTTLEYKVNIIRPIAVGTSVDAIGETDHIGRSTGVATGKIVGVEDGRLYATASTTCIVIKLEPTNPE